MNSFPEQKLSDYIVTMENVISAETCKEIIKVFEDIPMELKLESRNKHNSGAKKFWMYYFEDTNLKNYALVKQMVGVFNSCYAKYLQLHNTCMLPESANLSPLKIKKYDKNSDDQFPPHVDAGTTSHHRFIGMILYLNDVEVGGETEFECLAEPIKPVAGTMLMFPTLWMYKHRGNPTVSDDKYLLQSYARY